MLREYLAEPKISIKELLIVLFATAVVNLVVNLIPAYIAYYLITKYTHYTISFGIVYLLFFIPRANAKLTYKDLGID